MARYSLTKYILSIAVPADLVRYFGNTITIGGEGSYLQSMQLHLNAQLWTTEPDSTGSYVHNKNLDKTGTCELSLNQLATNVSKFITLCNLYYDNNEEYEGLTLTLTDLNQNKIATCEDCYITKIPDQQYQSTAQAQTWTLTCGAITFN